MVVRRLLCVAIVVIAAALSWPASAALAASVHPSVVQGPTSADQANPTTGDTLAGTTLQAEDRDDGGSPAPWLIGSGVAAAAAVAIGGTLLKRRMG